MTNRKLDDILEKFKQILTVEKIMTPREEFEYYEDSIDKLDETNFDILPAKNLKEYWNRKDKALHRITSEIIVNTDLELWNLIDYFKDRDFYFVEQNEEIVGLVHFSDLNKQYVRILFYIIISELELKMHKVCNEKYRENEEKIKSKLSEKRIEDINEMIDEDKNKNQELSFLEYLNFSDYLTILSKDEDFLKQISYTRGRFEEEFNYLNEFRNWTAHPTRRKFRVNKNIREAVIEGKDRSFRLYDLLDKYIVQ